MNGTRFFAIAAALFVLLLGGLQMTSTARASASPPIEEKHGEKDPPANAKAVVDLAPWIIADESSVWTQAELATVERVMTNTLAALERAGLDGAALLDGYRFRRVAGEFVGGKPGVIASVAHGSMVIRLSDKIFLPQYEFDLYHELGHVLDQRSNRALNERFHALTLEIDGVTARHEWTTAQGFFVRGYGHVDKLEATADAFAVWVFVGYAGNPLPYFKHMPDNANVGAIVEVFAQALQSAFGD
jgi:hypothetical protein